MRRKSTGSENRRSSLQAVEESGTYLVTHYAAANCMDAHTRALMQALLEGSGNSNAALPARSNKVLCAVCASCCSDCAELGPETREKQLASDALNLFNCFLEPVEGTAPWDCVEMWLVRAEARALVLMSECQQHKMEMWMFHNIDSACVGFVYKGATDFVQRHQ
jgi:hypothetical protein